jgi:hypothetical protein
MARRVFFSFHYQSDVWRANVVRNAHIVDGTAAAGFHDASLWEETKKQGDAAIKKLIDDALNGTTVTVVLIGSQTASRRYVAYELERSRARGNGLLGVYVHGIKDQNGNTTAMGQAPAALIAAGAPTYIWDQASFGAWVETAAKKAGR